jgi:hypothetical protein
MEEWMYEFIFISALVGSEWSASHPGRFISGERAPGTYRKGGWVGPKVGLDDVEKRKSFAIPAYYIYVVEVYVPSPDSH